MVSRNENRFGYLLRYITLILLMLLLAQDSLQDWKLAKPKAFAKTIGGVKTTSPASSLRGNRFPPSLTSRRRIPRQTQSTSQASNLIKHALNYLLEVSTLSPGQSDARYATDGYLSQEEVNKRISRLALPSTKSTMFVCSHPPSEFSKHYLGDAMTLNSVSECSLSNARLMFNPDGAHELCALIYHSLYGTDIEGHVIERDGKRLWLYYAENVVRLCLPLIERFDSCEFHNLYTKCSNIFFLHTSTCPVLLSENRYAIRHVFEYIFTSRSECLKKLCVGEYSLFKAETQGLQFVVSCMLSTDSDEACELLVGTKNNYSYNNEQWPCCYPYHNVHWYDSPEKYGLNGAWSFLSPWCRAAEIGLVVMVSCVAVGSSVGNALVVMVTVSLWRHSDTSNMLRLNLALADLFTSIFTIWPSLYHHIKPFIDSINLQENVRHIRVRLYSEKDHHLFQGIVFSSCTVVSLLTLFLLSFDRFVRTGRGLVYNHYITHRSVKVAIIFTWIVGISDALFMTHFMQETGNVQWLPMEQMRVRAERQTLDMRILGPFHQENRHILITQLLMTVSFMLATVPVGVDYITHNLLYDFFPAIGGFAGCKNNILITYLSWWLFVASAAWNPFIYNMQSAQFRADLRATLQKFVPQRIMAISKKQDANRNQVLAKRRRLLSRVGITDGLVAH
ncbi:uncharacterized protein LOC125042553 isoform X2 [Penaeus chinensis]|uniref:uncharacterized protein LOC125042553 isoform X2 n=1 Tax=Penaeus chinensis TaxID=139456 RepID=UPI001FB7D730|nr:uncharacterized protein LOC125042553 isoform X2 [Penaeus chinensis]